MGTSSNFPTPSAIQQKTLCDSKVPPAYQELKPQYSSISFMGHVCEPVNLLALRKVELDCWNMDISGE